VQHGWGLIMAQISTCPVEPDNIIELHHTGVAIAGNDGQRICGINPPCTSAPRSARSTITPALSLVLGDAGVDWLTDQRSRLRNFCAVGPAAFL
jgi:hypothetical protein